MNKALGINGTDQNPLQQFLRKSRSTFWSVGLFSCAVNILMLTGPLFMLQVYDRVLASRSVPTLIALFGLVAALYLFLGLFDFIRSKALSRVGYKLDIELAALTKKVWVFAGLFRGQVKAKPLNDLSSLRQFLCSNGLPALFDLPWVPVYLAIVYLLHTWLGLLATAGAVIVIIATILNELMTKKSIRRASAYELHDDQFAGNSNRNAASIIAMGMISKISAHWQTIRQNALSHSQLASGTSEFITAFIKAIRMLVQSSMLALGAYLAIHQEITPGTMIAASILGGRALAPVDAAVANWKNFIRARQAKARLSETLADEANVPPPVLLPTPQGKISVSQVIKFSPKQEQNSPEGKTILRGINFELEPGDGLGVIGPSASGKSSLAKLLVGLWMPEKGTVRFDGATFDQWDRNVVGQHIGYLPQNVGLLLGTIRQNIARFDDDITDEEVVQAAQLAGVHDLILNLPNGYSTDLFVNRHILSGGQVQRVALARAVLRKPVLIVLDEPNSNLDAEGDEALTQAITALREAGSCVIVMAHRPSTIAAVNKLLMIKNGNQVEFGEKNEVMAKVAQQTSKSQISTVE